MRKERSEDLLLSSSNGTYGNRGNSKASCRVGTPIEARRFTDEPKSKPENKEMTVAEQIKITALDNGPYLVKGSVVIVVDAEGNEFRAERETIALCRCGGSTTKPFCDGTHSKAGFRAAERAVREEEDQG